MNTGIILVQQKYLNFVVTSANHLKQSMVIRDIFEGYPIIFARLVEKCKSKGVEVVFPQ